VLDDIERADSHDELVGGFKSVADNLAAVLAKAGLESFGEAGEGFDPNQHEALTHAFSDVDSDPTCVQVYQRGYRYAGRVLRPARVAVAEPDAG
jgi:molecular chaperone GrpE